MKIAILLMALTTILGAADTITELKTGHSSRTNGTVPVFYPVGEGFLSARDVRLEARLSELSEPAIVSGKGADRDAVESACLRPARGAPADERGRAQRGAFDGGGDEPKTVSQTCGYFRRGRTGAITMWSCRLTNRWCW
jgi:hypothetical protein